MNISGPKSLGVGYDDKIASYTDLHHLRPADATVNSDRSNRRFALASTPYEKIDDFYIDDSEWSWEVSDALKGDVARFYGQRISGKTCVNKEFLIRLFIQNP